jgi:hypothetical protein
MIPLQTLKNPSKILTMIHCNADPEFNKVQISGHTLAFRPSRKIISRCYSWPKSEATGLSRISTPTTSKASLLKSTTTSKLPMSLSRPFLILTVCQNDRLISMSMRFGRNVSCLGSFNYFSPCMPLNLGLFENAEISATRGARRSSMVALSRLERYGAWGLREAALPYKIYSQIFSPSPMILLSMLPQT